MPFQFGTQIEEKTVADAKSILAIRLFASKFVRAKKR